MRRVSALLLLLIAAALVVPVAASAPHLSLKLEKVTCQEAVLALQRASGVPIELKPWESSGIPGAIEPSNQTLEERASFDWSNASFARAFRELADRYRLRPEPQRGGFALIQESIQGPLPQYGTGTSAVAMGMQVQVRGVALSGTRGRMATGDRLNLRLHGTGPLETVATVTTIENLLARDDRGGILRCDNPEVGVSRTYPDEWVAGLSLDGLQPNATRLDWLEGVVVAAPVRQVRKLEVSLPLPKEGVRRSAGTGLVEFLELSAAPRTRGTRSRNMAGATLALRLHDLHVRELADPHGYPGTVGPVLVGASGRTYSPPGIESRGEMRDGARVWKVTCTYPAIEEPLTGIRFEFGMRAEPKRLFRFRIPNVPLPSSYRGADTLYYHALFEQSFGSSRRDFATPGGVLLCPVRIGERPAPAGFLSLGLAPADGSNRTEWYSAEVTNGLFRLEGVRPGNYRVLRVYRPREETDVARPHWWYHGEVVARVEAGKETQLLPLEMPTQAAQPPVGERLGLGPRSDRMVAQVEDLFTNFARSRELSIPPRAESRAGLELTLSGTGSDVDPSLVARLGNVVGRDDLGNLVTTRSARDLTTSPRAGGFQWRQQLSLNAPHPKATLLSWLEGDLMAYGKPYPVEVQFPTPVPSAGAVQEQKGVRYEVDSLTSKPLPAVPGEPDGTEYLLRGRVRAAEGARMAVAGDGEEPVLIGQSGKIYRQEGNDDSRGGGLWEFRTRFVLAEPVVAIRLSLKMWPPFQPVGSFRLTNIALRTQRIFLPAGPRPQEIRRVPVPYYPGAIQIESLFAEGGGRLVLPVRIQNNPAPGGSLSLGIASLSGAKSGPIRWMEAEVVEGAVRIEELKPGTYRVLRVYLAREEPRVKGPGRWEKADLRVTVTAGKETVADPLRWVPVSASAQ